ncbi:hypothetical protein T265_02806 [Opisthorchis viverrini]|uniref:Uncharacterized protein n=1 Tax=Opisthorchis viverrini TaxID=6198 RepID=A0A075A5I7_OPIVI|nr:hypothetical protein T265_02806 [Opisthorchis viverrini]KER30880.1 hypothetical protein T265_02806 [Opisthorchis viverrini]
MSFRGVGSRKSGICHEETGPYRGVTVCAPQRSIELYWRVSRDNHRVSHTRLGRGWFVLSHRAEVSLLDWIPVDSRLCAVRLATSVKESHKRQVDRCLFIVTKSSIKTPKFRHLVNNDDSVKMRVLDSETESVVPVFKYVSVDYPSQVHHLPILFHLEHSVPISTYIGVCMVSSPKASLKEMVSGKDVHCLHSHPTSSLMK